MHTESLDPGLILLAFAPAFLLTIGWQAWYRPRGDRSIKTHKTKSRPIGRLLLAAVTRPYTASREARLRSCSFR